MIIDTHSHLSFKAYDNDRDEVIKRTQKEGVVLIEVGTKYETSKLAVELAEKNVNIFAAIGMHPIHIKTDLLKLRMDENEGAFAPLGEEHDKAKYLELAKSPKVKAIGEIGLDYYYRPKSETKKEQFKNLQKKVFVEQLELAEELNLPVIIHCRMAHQDVTDILKSEARKSLPAGRQAKSETELRGVIHCFTGTIQEMQEYIKLGFYIGINGIMDKLDLIEVIKNCPLDKILVETDGPYLTPKEEGDRRNEPIFVKHVIQKIADIKGSTFDQVALATTQNAQKLFRI